MPLLFLILGAFRAGVLHCTTGTGKATKRAPAIPAAGGPRPIWSGWFSGRSAAQVSTMILPQVHLRKPCYDFSFL